MYEYKPLRAIICKSDLFYFFKKNVITANLEIEPQQLHYRNSCIDFNLQISNNNIFFPFNVFLLKVLTLFEYKKYDNLR